MRFPRSCGVLVHPTSFPSEYGIGDFGHAAYNFIDFLDKTGQTIWQVLPLGPVGYGNSPYASYSAFSGNHYLISPDLLAEQGLLTQEELNNEKMPSTTKVDYDEVVVKKNHLFSLAASRFYEKLDAETEAAFKAFQDQNGYWLEDYCLFMASFEHFGKKSWPDWDADLAKRKKAKMKAYTKELEEGVKFHLWAQYEFFSQWMKLKEYANNKMIRVVGDIPIFVDHNSADVWAHSKYFALDKDGRRELVAGVPPDYFSETGQLWGNPLYKWNILKKDKYSWWIERFKHMFKMYDAIRVDHFRGFDAYWEVKADAKTAVNGRWVKGPGKDLFNTIRQQLGEVPIIAEDLGVVTQDVVDLRVSNDFPGMRILQFAWGGNTANSFQPHNYDQNTVVYSGTHDNDTTLGWYAQAPDLEKHRVRVYTRTDGSTINWELIRLGMMSVADQAIFPLQDYMNLGTEHRMNMPGTATGNWDWRYTQEMLDNLQTHQLMEWIEIANRDPRLGITDSSIEELKVEEA